MKGGGGEASTWIKSKVPNVSLRHCLSAFEIDRGENETEGISFRRSEVPFYVMKDVS